MKVLTGLLNMSSVCAGRSYLSLGVRDKSRRCPLAGRGYPFRACLCTCMALPIMHCFSWIPACMENPPARGFSWIPAFAGMTGTGDSNACTVSTFLPRPRGGPPPWQACAGMTEIRLGDARRHSRASGNPLLKFLARRSGGFPPWPASKGLPGRSSPVPRTTAKRADWPA